jgi:hypothetical protein
LIYWVEHHGFECLLACFLFALITSVMPPLPIGKGWWVTWIYNIVQLAGANAGNLVKHVPAGQRLEALVANTSITDNKGNVTEQHLEATTTTAPKT